MEMHIENLFSVDGKVALVTGGSRGIGYMIADGLIRNGVRVYITSRKAKDCDLAAQKLREFGDCISIPADVSSAEGILSLTSQLREEESKLDILVNNAGAAWGAPLGEFPDAGFEKVMDINVKAPFMLTQELLPELRSAATAEDPARVIMIGSVDGLRVPFGDNYSYSASKAGVHMMARHMAHHLVKENININTIAPGPFESKMMSYMLDNPKRRAGVVASTPQGRIGTPEDITGAVIFLASRASAWLTGITLPVDGGISTHG